MIILLRFTFILRITMVTRLHRQTIDSSLAPNPNADCSAFRSAAIPSSFDLPSIRRSNHCTIPTTTDKLDPHFLFIVTSLKDVNQLVDSRQPVRCRLRSIRRFRSPRPQVSRHLRRKDCQLEHCCTLPGTVPKAPKHHTLFPS
jgi:hypothetical protein